MQLEWNRVKVTILNKYPIWNERLCAKMPGCWTFSMQRYLPTIRYKYNVINIIAPTFWMKQSAFSDSVSMLDIKYKLKFPSFHNKVRGSKGIMVKLWSLMYQNVFNNENTNKNFIN